MEVKVHDLVGGGVINNSGSYVIGHHLGVMGQVNSSLSPEEYVKVLVHHSLIFILSSKVTERLKWTPINSSFCIKDRTFPNP